ncbi:MAG: adenylyl-sulfate kinase, partial [Acidobacteriota bacterium]
TGLSGTGKSTLAHAVIGELQREGQRPLLLDGDALRDALESLEEGAQHDRDRRARRAWRLAALARLAAVQGVPVVVATISLFHATQYWNRAGLVPYCEVLLHASPDILRERNPGLYGSDGREGPRDVVGVDILAEFPKQPELLLAQHFKMEELPRHTAQVMTLWHDLTKRSAPNS